MSADARPDSEAHQLIFAADSTLRTAARQLDRARLYGSWTAGWEDTVALLGRTAVTLRRLQELGGVDPTTAAQLPPCHWCGRPTADVVDDHPGHQSCKARAWQPTTATPPRSAEQLTRFEFAVRTRFPDATGHEIAALLAAAAETLAGNPAAAPQAAPATPDTAQLEAPQTAAEPPAAPDTPPTGREFDGEDDENTIATRTIRNPEAFPDASDADIAAALSLFHKHLTVDGAPVHLVRSPAHTGAVLHDRLVAFHGKMTPPTRLIDPDVWAITKAGQADGEGLVRPLGFVTPDLDLRVGQWITQTDVNAQFLAVSEIPLGDGEPLHYDLDAIRALTDADRLALVGSPGYARIGGKVDLSACPIWVRASLDRLTIGSSIALPVVSYLRQAHDTRLPLDHLICWPPGHRGPRLRVWGRHVRDARKDLLALGVESLPVLYAVHLIKAVYSAFLGGELRSEQHNQGDTLRPDWNDMFVSTARCNVFRALDKHAAPKKPGEPGIVPLGGITDSLWWLSDDPEPFTPPGWEMPPDRQPGKWKLDRHVEVTAEIVAAYATGSQAYLNKAIKAEWDRRNTS